MDIADRGEMSVTAFVVEYGAPASAAGSAAAAAVTGWAIDSLGARGGFVVTATSAAAMTLQSRAGVRLPRAPKGQSARVEPSAK